MLNNLVKKIFIVALFAIMNVMPTFASEVPSVNLEALKAEFVGLNVRFDALVELSDGTQYIPVFPVEFKDCENPGDVKLILPQDKQIKDKPDLILFNNNFSLLKVIRKVGKPPILPSYVEMPLEVKLGLLPQDLLVPENLVIPPELRIILGDIVIPVAEVDEFKYLEESEYVYEKLALPAKKEKRLVAYNYPDLLDKNFYIANYNSNHIHILDPQVGRPEARIKVDSIPTDLALSLDKRYLLVPALAKGSLYVVDVTNNKVVKQIETGEAPSSIAIMNSKNIAYVANKDSSTISIVDLKNMVKLKDIPVIGKPTKLSLSFYQRNLVYVDDMTNDIYNVPLDKEVYPCTLIGRVNGISKVYNYLNFYYVLSRTKNKFSVIDGNSKEVVNSVDVGIKPLDFKIFKDRIFVLNAGSDSVSVIDPKDYSVIKTVNLASGGFPRKMIILNDRKHALITNTSTNEIIVYDLYTDKVIEKIPVSVTINSMVMMNK